MSSQDVVVSLTNWHFMGDKEFTKGHLDKVITPYLINQCKAKGGIMADLEFTWHSTSQANTWRLETNNEQAAMFICNSIIDLPVKQQDQLANMNFKSNHHKLGKHALSQYFGTLALKEIHDEFKAPSPLTHEEQVGSMVWEGCSLGSWSVAEAAPAEPSARPVTARVHCLGTQLLGMCTHSMPQASTI